MRIAQVSPLWFSVPPKKYGGIERVVSLLTEELVRRGHEVTLFAAPGSVTKAKLISVSDTPLVEAGIIWSNPLWNLKNLELASKLAQGGAFDIIHSHLDVFALFFQNLIKTPMLHTMHGNLMSGGDAFFNGDRVRLFKEDAAHTPVVFVSESSRRLSVVNFPRSFVIHNAIDLNHFRFAAHGGDSFIWIARIDPEKGLENAIAAVELCDARLRIAGRIDPHHRTYFETRIEPHLDSKIEYVGELSHEELPAFYASGKALLFPIEWDEPFGLVVAESMACGTPVIAYRRGSMPELIDDEVSGFVIHSNLDALIHAMAQVEDIDRFVVRRQAEARFDPAKMAEAYESVYEQLRVK